MFWIPGGNAGMAAAYSARKLGVPATIVVPIVTPSGTVQRLYHEGADVIIHGKVSDRILHYSIFIFTNIPDSSGPRKKKTPTSTKKNPYY